MNRSGILRVIECNIKKKNNPKSKGSMFEETWPDHAISNAVTATNLSLSHANKFEKFVYF